MIIRRINVTKFGKVVEKNIDFEDGFNIIYGENESGKSTLQTFIKACFYGLSSKRIKDLRENERLRYLSINDNKAEGQIDFSYRENEYLIRRTFGSTKKEDTIQAIDSITGEEIEAMNNDGVGKYIFDVNSQAFENTLFIRQLSGEVKNSKEDDIIHKISNSFQTGNENISYQKAKNTLEQYKKSLVTQRKGGKLDLLRIRYDNLLEERNNAFKLAEANLDNEKMYLELNSKKEKLEIAIKKLEIYKKHLKRLKLKEEYSEITEYLKKSQQLKKQKEEYEHNLVSDNGIVDYHFLDELQEETAGIFNLLDNYNQKLEEERILLEELESKRNYLSLYSSFKSFDSDIDEKVIKVSMEQRHIEEKISTVLDTNEEISRIEIEIERKIGNLKDYNVIKEQRESIDTLLNNYEESLKELKFLIDRQSKVKVNETDVKRFKTKDLFLKIVAVLMVAFAAVFILIGSLRLILLGISMPISLGFMVISMISYIFINKNKYSLEQATNNFKEQGEIDRLRDAVEEYEKKLNGYFDIAESSNYIDFKKYLNSFDNYKNEIKVLEAIINEKKNSIKNINIYELEDVAIQNEKIINSVLSITKSSNVEEFVQNMKQYQIINQEVLELNNRAEAIRKNVEYILSDIEQKKQAIYTKLRTLSLEHIRLEDIIEEIKNLRFKLQQREELIVRLNSIEETYKVLLKDRDIQAIEEEIKEIINETNEFSYENEEDIENEIKIKQVELLNVEKSIKDIEYSIKNIFLSSRRLDVIEQDIEFVGKQIKEYERKVKAIEIAQEVMDESFKEIQKSFGPILNQKVATIFSKITMGKYEDVKVTENFDITVKQSIDGRYIKAEYLSNGAWDQAYIALRLALIDMIFEDKNVPIILDDAFVQYDDIRLKNILDYLYDISYKRQVLLFTCQRREVDILSDREKVNIINL
ncbi:AAA family ATPase [Clostridium sp. C8-1-8]|uniref:ATP-binding protein n=1 Tax=Clostridium sp. C8-1-8 TaxID=2698831 RepID=UPI00136C5027|nr:AAA family ATPase [Clostridium sp. C8-1-8]